MMNINIPEFTVIENSAFLEWLQSIGIQINMNDAVIALQSWCEKFIYWQLTKSVTYIIVSMLFMIFVTGFLYKRGQKANNLKWDLDWDCFSPRTKYYIAAGVITLIGMLVILFHIFTIIKCLTFPEKAILDWIDFWYMPIQGE